MVILEQGAEKNRKRTMEQREILKRSMDQEKNRGARRKNKKEQGAWKNEKVARKKVKKGARGKKLKGAGSEGENRERSKEHRSPLTEAQQPLDHTNTACSWTRSCE